MKKDWVEVELGSVLIQSKEKHKPTVEEDIFYVGLEHIEKGQGTLTDFNRIEKIATLKNKFEPEQILYGKLRPYLNKVYLARESGVCSTDIVVFKPSKALFPRFAHLYMLSQTFVNQMSENTSGVNLPRVSTSYIKSYPFPLPPLPEQRAIVSRIEELFSELDHSIANLKSAQTKLEIYRQAVLKKAFEGGLTEEWRNQQSKMFLVEEFKHRLKRERILRYETHLTEWKETIEKRTNNDVNYKMPSKPSKPKFFNDVTIEEKNNYGSLPANWELVRLGNATYKIGDVDHKMPKDSKSGIPYLSTGNIKADGYLDFENAKIISEEDYLRLSLKIKPEKGDIIFPRYGTIGRNIMVNTDAKFLVSYSCAIIKTMRNVMDEKFIFYYTLSPAVKKEIQRYTVQTTQANIGIASIEQFIFPLCSIEEQGQIVQEIESRLSVADKMAETIETNLKKSESLRQSILKRAFEGKLLSEVELDACRKEADWEPAERLLKKLKI